MQWFSLKASESYLASYIAAIVLSVRIVYLYTTNAVHDAVVIGDMEQARANAWMQQWTHFVTARIAAIVE